MKIKGKHRLNWSHWYVIETYPDGTSRKVWISQKDYRKILDECYAWEISETIGLLDGKIYLVREEAYPVMETKWNYRDAEINCLGRMAELVMEGV